jgi:two-component system, LytTR family, response regulator
MLRALIVDDERSSREVLKQLLIDFCPEIEIIGEVSSAQLAYEFVLQTQTDLVFLDIQMPTGNGFTLLQKFEVLPFDVIFVTSFDQYAISAIKLSALDYLLKPIAINLLKDAVIKALRTNELKSNKHPQMINLLQLVNPEVIEKKIALHHHDNVKLVKLSEVIYIEGNINYTDITVISGEKYSSSKTLKEFEEYLSPFNFFIRIHKTAIININHISKYSKGDPFIIVMQNKKEFEASRRRKHEVLEKLKS